MSLKIIQKKDNQRKSFQATYRSQSTIKSRDMSFAGSPTDVGTITMDTMPACGIPATAVLAAVTIKLKKKQQWRGWWCVMYYCFLVCPRTRHMTQMFHCVGFYFTVLKSLCRQYQKTWAANTALEVAISHRDPLSALQNKSSWTPELSWTKRKVALAAGQD